MRDESSLSLGALEQGTCVKVDGVLITEDFRMLKAEISVHINGLTPLDGNNLILGIANGELTVDEIAEAIVANGPINRTQRLQQERAERNVKIVSTTDKQLSSETIARFRNKYGGPIIELKHPWTYSNSDGWSWFIYNRGPGLTAGGAASLLATYYGVWVT